MNFRPLASQVCSCLGPPGHESCRPPTNELAPSGGMRANAMIINLWQLRLADTGIPWILAAFSPALAAPGGPPAFKSWVDFWGSGSRVYTGVGHEISRALH